MQTNKIDINIHFLFSNYDSHLIITSSRFWFLAETLKQATVLFYFNVSSDIVWITYCYFKQPARSFLLPRTNNGIPDRDLYWSN